MNLFRIREFLLSMLDFTYGCTEPAAIALNGAKSKEILIDYLYEKYNDFDNENILQNSLIFFIIDKMTYKNAYNVGIPLCNIKGIKEFYFSGFLFGNSKDKLEIFNSIKEQELLLIKQILNNNNNYISNDKISNISYKKLSFLIHLSKKLKIKTVEFNRLLLLTLILIKDKIFIIKTEEFHDKIEILQINLRDLINRISNIDKKFIIKNLNDVNNISNFINKITSKSTFIKLINLLFDGKENRIEKRYLLNKEIYYIETWYHIIDELYNDKEIKEKIVEGAVCNVLTSYEKNELTCIDDNFVSSAIYNRMIGKRLKVLACAKSGNKGITALASVLNYYLTRNHKSLIDEVLINYCEEKRDYYYSIIKKIVLQDVKLIKSLILSCLITSIITYKFGFISSICGVIYGAGAGFLGAILYYDDRLELFEKAFLNYISTFGGVFCDGAKTSCASRGYVSVKTAIKAKDLIDKSFVFSYKDGYLGKNFMNTLDNLTKFNSILNKINSKMIDILESK